MTSNTLNNLKSDFARFFNDNKKLIFVFFCAYLVLIANRYLSEADNLILLLDKLGLQSMKLKCEEWFFYSSKSRLYSLIYWVSVINIFYLIIPVLIIKFVLKERARDHGLAIHLEKDFYKYYLLFMAVMIPLVYWASTTHAFQSKYPFYRIQPGTPLAPDFMIWELFYISQFFCLEFFFRGFMVKGLQGKFGALSIFIMVIPYCMIHFGKPVAETIGSVFAGLALGYISYKGKGILTGFLMHITVALTMDFLALYQKGFFN
ncbi:MAG TPA: CPBP family intramembrane glutamic endopeptidase [Bacteroidia bacterium]